jgi:hypothetical protein
MAAVFGYTTPTTHVKGAALNPPPPPPPRPAFDSGYVPETRLRSSGYWDEDDMLNTKLLHGAITHDEARSRLEREFFHGCFLVYTNPTKDTMHYILYREALGDNNLLTVREDNAGRFSCASVQGARDLQEVVRRLKLEGVPLLYPVKADSEAEA